MATLAALLCVGTAGRAALAWPPASEAGTVGSAPRSGDAESVAGARAASTASGRGEVSESGDRGGRLARGLLLFLALGLLPAALRPRRG